MRVALYARVSTQEQAIIGLSLDAQLTALREYASGYTIVDEYVDEGVSARSPASKRPQLQRMLKDVEHGKIDLILFCRLDRFFRNVREYYKADEILEAHGVAWKAIHEDYETQTAAGRMKVGIMLVVAQDEADRTSERVKAVFAEKRRKGLLVNGHTPLGITYDEGRMRVNEDAEKVKTLFTMYQAGRNITNLTKQSAEILGRPYAPRSIQQMLQNDKYVTAGIITPEQFQNVQNIMEQRATRRGRTDRVYLFSGLLVCPECGYRLTVRTVTPKDKTYVYYRCEHCLKNGRCSWKGTVREDVLEEFMKKRLLSIVAGHNIRVSKKMKKSVDVGQLQKKLDKLTDLYLEDKITKEDFDKRADPLRDAIKSARLVPHEADETQIMDALDVYPTLSKTSQKAFWSLIVKRIVPTDEGFDVDLVLL